MTAASRNPRPGVRPESPDRSGGTGASSGLSGATREPGELFGPRFELFADVLVLGLVISLGCLPLLTAPAALATGCALLRRRLLYDEPVTAGRFLAVFGARLRDAPGRELAAGAVCAGAALLVLADLLLAAAGLPGAPLFAGVLALLAGCGAVVALRACALPGEARRPPGARPSPGTAGRESSGTAGEASGTAAREAPGTGVPGAGTPSPGIPGAGTSGGRDAGGRRTGYRDGDGRDTGGPDPGTGGPDPRSVRRGWRRAVRSAAVRSAADLPGSGLVLLALATAAVCGWMLPPLLFLVPGPLALALTAVEAR
ncbi:hypothetical protein [Streptomyces sp. NPDC048845]|uniref:hypothetical protein n=1 Tax=Streptomyces sp. NPDC048845 TaxID=3155390 RepID=UPI0034408A06